MDGWLAAHPHPENYELLIHGMVEREVTLDYRQLLARPLVEASGCSFRMHPRHQAFTL